MRKITKIKIILDQKIEIIEHDKISKYGKYHGKNGVKQRYKCQNPECKKTFNDFSKSPVSSSKKGLDKWLLYAQCMINGNTIRQCA